MPDVPLNAPTGQLEAAVARSRRLAACLLVSGSLLVLVAGCGRAFYRRQADREVHGLVDCGATQTATDPRSPLNDFTIQPDPTSRFFSPYSPDCPPMPPDDPTSHQLMHCVDGKRGWPYERHYGRTEHVENPAWMQSLLPYLKSKEGTEQAKEGTEPGADQEVREESEEDIEDVVVVLNQEAAANLALLHSREYQRALESLYLSALDVTFQRFRFDAQFFGGNSTFFTKSGPLSGQGGDSSTLRTTSPVGATRLLASGGQLAAEVANSVVWQFSGADGHSSVTPVSLQLMQPLLRGAGRAVVLEELTDSERALLANIRQMERFRRGFYLQIIAGRSPGPGPSSGRLGLGTFSAGGGGGVGGYLSLLEQQLRLRNLRGNVTALRDSLERIDLFYEYGRISRRQVDELLQNLYSSQISLRSDTTAYFDQLDTYKITLGLPPQLDVEIEDPLLEPFDLIDPGLSATQEEVSRVLTPIRDIWARVGSAQEAADAAGDATEAAGAAQAVQAAARSAAAAAEAADKATQAAEAAGAGDDAKTAQAAAEAAQAAATAAQAAAEATQAAADAAQAAAVKAQAAAETAKVAAGYDETARDAVEAGPMAREAAEAATQANQAATQAAEAAKAGDLARTIEALNQAAQAAADAAEAAAAATDRAAGAGAELKAAEAVAQVAEAAAVAATAAAEAVEAAAEAVEAAEADDQPRIAAITRKAALSCSRAGEAAISVGKAAGSVVEAATNAVSKSLQAAKTAQAAAEAISHAAEVAKVRDHSKAHTQAFDATVDAAAKAAEAARGDEHLGAAQAALAAAVSAIDAAEAATQAAQAAIEATAEAAQAAKTKVLNTAPAALDEAVKALWPTPEDGQGLPQRVNQHVNRVEADVELLSKPETIETRIRHLQHLAQREEFRQGEVDPRVVDVEALRRRVLQVNVDFFGSQDPHVLELADKLLETPDDRDWFTQLAGILGLGHELPDKVAELEQGFREGTAEAAKAAGEDLATWRGLLGRLEELLNLLSGQLLELSLVQARARLDTSTLIPVDLDPSTEPIDLDPAQALEIARANRRDWMNARAALVDRWRQVEVVANTLESDLDLIFEGDLTTRSDTLVPIHNTTGQIRVGFEFDAPLTRLAERNAYRRALIDYQQARREYYTFEDQVGRVLRDALRSIQLSQIQFELNRASVHTAIDRVEQIRLGLQRPPRPEEEEFTLGAETARELVNALASLLQRQNTFLRVWLDYRIQQMSLDFDLGIMELDARGLWVPSPLVGGEPPTLPQGPEEIPTPAPEIQLDLSFPPLDELPPLEREEKPAPDVALRDVPGVHDADRPPRRVALRQIEQKAM